MKKLPGDYVSGFTDGEGCFALKFRREVKHNRKSAPVYFYWDIEFAIVLKNDDKEILEKIQNTFECGTISKSTYGTTRYAVNDINELSSKIIPFFEKYPLHAKKKQDFELWKEAVKIFLKNQRKKVNIEKGKSGFQKTNWDLNDIKRLEQIHEEMRGIKGGNRGDWKWIK